MQRQEAPEEEEEETVQTKATSNKTSSVSPTTENQIQSLKGGGKPLSPPERAFFEQRFGHDFSQVRVHTDAQAADSARAVNARAFTVGQDTMFGAGEYAPETERGKQLLAHELTHVVQQTSGLSTLGPRIQRLPQNGGPTATPAPAAVEPTTEPTPDETAAPALIVEDEVAELGPGQMRKSEFLAEVRAAICNTVGPVLASVGRSTSGCPYLELVFKFFDRRDVRYIERTLHQFAREATGIDTARAYIPIITERVRQSTEVWVRTGQITGLPEGVPTSLREAALSARSEGNVAPAGSV